MKIGIDASNLRRGGGITHIVELLRAASPQLYKFDQVIIWGSSVTLNRIDDREWLLKEYVPLLERTLLFRIYWQRFRLARLARASGCNILLVPGGADASGFRPFVTMSRNMLPFEWRESRRYGFTWLTLKNLLLHFSQKYTFRRADGLIFLTRYAQDAVMKIVGKTDAKLTVIPHGIDKRFSGVHLRAQHQKRESGADKIIKLLYVSIIEVYKHQWHVVEAVASLREMGFTVTLDLVGPSYGPAMQRLQAVLNRVDPGEKFIRYCGEMSYDALHELYAGADINIFASSCENMPNILLEAMAAGLPIACSTRGPMPEVLGDAGVYFDPESPLEIATAIRTLIERPELRLEKARMAFERSQLYSWKKCADQTFEFLEKVIVSTRR